jgi:hypothetical protein
VFEKGSHRVFNTYHWKEGEELSGLTLHVSQQRIPLDLFHLHYLNKEFIHDFAKKDNLGGEG